MSTFLFVFRFTEEVPPGLYYISLGKDLPFSGTIEPVDAFMDYTSNYYISRPLKLYVNRYPDKFNDPDFIESITVVRTNLQRVMQRSLIVKNRRKYTPINSVRDFNSLLWGSPYSGEYTFRFPRFTLNGTRMRRLEVVVTPGCDLTKVRRKMFKNLGIDRDFLYDNVIPDVDIEYLRVGNKGDENYLIVEDDARIARKKLEKRLKLPEGYQRYAAPLEHGQRFHRKLEDVERGVDPYDPNDNRIWYDKLMDRYPFHERYDPSDPLYEYESDEDEDEEMELTEEEAGMGLYGRGKRKAEVDAEDLRDDLMYYPRFPEPNYGASLDELNRQYLSVIQWISQMEMGLQLNKEGYENALRSGFNDLRSIYMRKCKECSQVLERLKGIKARIEREVSFRTAVIPFINN